MNETRILIRLLWMYIPRTWEFGSALSKLGTSLVPTFWRSQQPPSSGCTEPPVRPIHRHKAPNQTTNHITSVQSAPVTHTLHSHRQCVFPSVRASLPAVPPSLSLSATDCTSSLNDVPCGHAVYVSAAARILGLRVRNPPRYMHVCLL
jgi:hypothetical protein